MSTATATAAKDARPCTDKQVQFIATLVKERELDGDLLRDVAIAREFVMMQQLSSHGASQLITDLLAAPRKSDEGVRAAADTTEAPEGMHRLDGVIYKVQRAVNGNGNVYAKRLDLTEPDCGGCANGEPCGLGCEWGAEFVYAPGAIRKLSESTVMKLAEAKEFGALYGTCVRCGRTLTDEGSIAAGIGPICASKF